MQLLTALARSIDTLNDTLGRAVAWLALPMVLVQVAIVLMRYVFGVGSVMLQETMVYMHAGLFMIAAGYTLLFNDHVRIDIFYREASARRKALVDLTGVIAFLIPACALIAWVSWPYVSSSWSVLEGSRETSGIPAVFLLKSLIPAFAVLVGLQGVAMGVRAALVLAGLPWPHPEPTDDAP